MGDEFDDLVVEVEEGNEDEHDSHVDEKSEDAAHDEFEEFIEDATVFNFEDEAAVCEVGEEDRDDPRNDIGDLELEGVVGVEDGENKGVIGAEADEGGEDTDDEVANDFCVFGVFGLQEASEFCKGHFLRSSEERGAVELCGKLVSRVM